jgi:hypothetical protein
VGLYWVELSVCIIPPIIYNLLPPWTYPILGNHVNLLVCVLFVFAFGPVCTTITNDKLRSARHRVFSGEVGPRISITCFLYPSSAKNLKQYGIIKELQHGNPAAIYRETDTAELREKIRASGPSPSTLSRFKE